MTGNTPAETHLDNAMDYSEHERTYGVFLWLVKWGIIFHVALLAAMALGFYGGWGLFGGIVALVVMMVAAVMLF